VLGLFPIFFAASIMNHNTLLTPSLTYVFRPGMYITAIQPTDLTHIVRTADQHIPWKLATNIFRFSIRIPRIIPSVRVQVDLQNESQQSLSFSAIGIGARKLTTIIYSNMMNNLEWPRSSDGTFSIWQKPSRTTVTPTNYTTIDAIRTSTVARSKIGVVGIDPMYFTVPPASSPAGSDQLSLPSIRGEHILYAYVQNGELRFSGSFIDRNTIVGPDTVRVLVGRSDQLFGDQKHWNFTQSFRDDGRVAADGTNSDARTFSIALSNVTSGIYRIELIATDDILFQNLRSSAVYTNFYDHLHLAEGVQYSTPSTQRTLETNGGFLSFRTSHVTGLQQIRLGATTVTLSATNQEKRVVATKAVSTITIPKPDVTIATDGVIATQGFQLLGLPAREITFDAAKSAVDPISILVARYTPTTEKKISFSREYTISELEVHAHDLSFQIDAPQLQEQNNLVGFRSIQATLVRGPFPWHKVFQKIMPF
jgi:hypothetical protein